MFAELEEEFRDDDPNTTGTSRKRARFLQDDEIEGQVADSRGGRALSVDFQSYSDGKGKQIDTEEIVSESDVDDEERAALAEGVDEELGAGAKKTHPPLLDAFNMRSEQQEGRFDDQGNYIRKAADPDAIHDTWLEGVSKKDIRKAKEAAEKRDEERRQKAIANDSVLTKDILKTLITHLEQGETVLESLARLGKGHERKPKWQNRNRNKNKLKKGDIAAEDVEMDQGDPTEKSRKQAIEDITGAADILLTRGQAEIYDAQRELLIRNYKRETGEEWVDPQPLNEGSSSPNTSDENTMWEYRWSDARDGGEKHGPYEGAMMESWSTAGYFGDGVEFRRAGDTGAWSREVNFLQ
jgi:CD2 antigen cytoplasmic tail-binding protein 2